MNQNNLLSGIVSGALCLTIGFGSGALLTRPNRDKTNATIAAIEAKTEELQKKAQKEIQVTQSETTRLQIELRNVTRKLKETEDNLKHVLSELDDTKKKAAVKDITLPRIESKPIARKPVSPKTSDRIVEVMTPIFGVRLGESLRSLKKRFTVTASTYSFEDKDHPGRLWDINSSNSNVKRLMVSMFNERVYRINILFADGSKTNYETIREQLKRKYQSEDKGGLTGAMFGEAKFMTTLDGIRIGIELNHDIGFMEDDKLELNYSHIAIRQKVYEEIQERKAAKVKADL